MKFLFQQKKIKREKERARRIEENINGYNQSTLCAQNANE